MTVAGLWLIYVMTGYWHTNCHRRLYTGGGHGPQASKRGLTADQVLEWEVITADGKHIVATADHHPGLFSALRGGGGGTFGVVLLVMVKAFPDTFVSTVSLKIYNNGTNTNLIYLAPVSAPGLHEVDLHEFFEPMTGRMNQLGLQYDCSSSEHCNF